MLCHRTEAGPGEGQIACFLLREGRWELAALGDLTPESESVLAAIVPEEASVALFGVSDKWLIRTGYRARHLYSGIGELLGLFVCLNPSACEPASTVAVLDSLCRLAELAIEQRNLLDELTWQAEHDTVTGLCARTRFERVLGHRLPASAGVASTALLCINLDRFRLVNGVLGHSVGNRVLRCVGIRFAACLPGGALLARVGGDEFAVLAAAEEAIPLAESLINCLREPFSVDQHEIFVSASIGLSHARRSTSSESLQREAYIALYHAKRAGKGRWMQFDSSMESTPPERLEMEKCLRSALAKNEMSLAFQAQIDLSTGRVRGAEALLRWNPEGLGSISPAAFIPILEETGLIREFGLWVLREVCLQGVAWIRDHEATLRLAVNVSALQFLNPGFPQDVERILTETGFPPELLELELTESIFVDDFPRAHLVFLALRRLGVILAIDDFGTGQSSLSYLQKLPFQRLKIDRAFVAPITDGDKPHPLVANIVNMAKSLGMTTIAEGIDHIGQLDLLRSIGCDEGQGYFFSLPIPAGEFLELWRDLISPEQLVRAPA
jgi:diguanylate cyclase (GGDEF)-like protein